MDTIELHVEARDGTGKGVCRRLRAEGRIPAVIYGHGLAPKPIALRLDAFIDAMQGEMGRNTQFVLRGDGDVEGRLVIPREVQRTAISREVIHVDLLQVEEGRELVVTVPVTLVGTPKGVKAGGVLRQLRRDVEVSCLASRIPATIEVDVTALEVGQALSITGMTLEEGVRAHYRHEFAICRVLVPRGADAEEGEEEGSTEAESVS